MVASSSDELDLEKQHRAPDALRRTASRTESRHTVEEEDWAAGHDPITTTSSRVPDEGPPDSQDDDDDDSENEPQSVVGRVLSRITSKSSIDPGPPPDGGLRAWSQCLVCHLVIFNTWGWANSFGTFQAYYTEKLNRSPSEISWIGSLNVFLLFFIGSFTGRLTDAGYFRVIFLTGSVLLTLGMFATANCTSYWQFILAQGLCTGLGHGCLFCPTLAVLSTYFQKNRALALGIAACGSATGGLVFPIMVRQLLPDKGFPWTVRAIAFVQVAVLVATNLLAKTRIKPRKTGPLLELAAFKELEYTFYAAGAFFNFWGVYFAFFYLAAFSRDALHPPLSYPDSLNLLLILNGVGIIGRVVPNYIADRVGPINVFIPTSITAAGLMYAFIGTKNPSGLYAWSVIYGIVAAGIQSLFPAALSSLTTDLRKLGVRMGMVFTIVSFAVLTGPPVAGAIVSSSAGYTGAKAFAGTSITVGCGFLCAAKISRMRRLGLSWKGRV